MNLDDRLNPDDLPVVKQLERSVAELREILEWEKSRMGSVSRGSL